MKFVCPRCHRLYAISPPRWRCDCGSYLDLQFNPSFPIRKILKRPPTLWRYREAIPVGDEGAAVSMGEGFTPLEEITLAGRRVFIKIDYLFPTGSYKDRGASVLIGKAKELGVRAVVEDSSGNAGCAVAAYCARARIGCTIYVPKATSPGKLVQIATYGAGLKRVNGSREQTAEAVMQAAANTYYASHCWNPFFLHGTKTFAFEIWEQMNGRAPDRIVLPVGHGTLLLGCYIGFSELKKAGLVNRLPKLVAIQSNACAPLVGGFKRGLENPIKIVPKETMAEGIAIARPVRGRQILRAVRETGGEVLSVTDRDVAVSLREMGERGHYIEPTAAATIAGLKKLLKHIKNDDEIVISTLTGVGLKATEKIAHLSAEATLKSRI
jgi:threonine synthase